MSAGMVQVPQWCVLVCAVGALSGLFVLPGAGLLRLARVRGLLALALGPAISALLYGVAGVVLARAGIPWGPPGLLLVSVSFVVLAVAIGRWLPPEHLLGCAPMSPTVRRLTWVAALFAGGLVVVGLGLGMPDPAAPLQVRDAVVHVNGLELVRQQHNASLFGGLDLVVSHAGAGSFYPSLWHGVLALVPVGSAGLVTNAGVFVVAIVLWPLSMVALARAVFPNLDWAGPVVALCSGAFSFFPFSQTVLSAQFPNALGTTMIPAVLAAMVLWVRAWQAVPRGRLRRRLQFAGAAILLGGVAGMGLAHPNTLFSYALVAGPYLLVVWWRAARAGRRSAALDWRWVAVAVAAVAAGWYAAKLTGLDGVLGSVMRYEQLLSTRSYSYTVSRLLTGNGLTAGPGNLVLAVLVLTGVVVLIRGHRLRWLVVAWGLTIVFAALAGGPENPLRGLTGFWYKHVFRLEALYPITALLLVVVGLEWWSGGIARRVPWKFLRAAPARVGTVVLIAALVLSAGFQVGAVASRTASAAYDPVAGGHRIIATQDDRRLLARLPELVPEDAVIIGDPNGGATYIFSYGGRTPVYYRLGIDQLSRDQTYLAQNFDKIATDPAVCVALKRLQVGYLYLNTDGIDPTTELNLPSRALRDVDVSVGFQPVAAEGSAALLRITACD